MTRPLRVAYLVRAFPVVSEYFVQTELRAVVRRGCRVTVCPVAPPDPAEAAEPAVRVPIRPLAVPGRGAALRAFAASAARGLRVAPGRTLAYLRDEARAARQEGVATVNLMPLLGHDLVHVHFASHHALHALAARERLGIPFTVTVHAHEIFKRPDVERLGRILGGAAGVVTVSDHNARVIRDLVGGSVADRIHVIRCGIDLEELPEPRAKGGANGPALVFVGRMVESKGPLALLGAFGRVAAAHPGARLTMIGGGPLLTPARELAEALGLGDRVTLPGPRPHGEVARCMARSDVFVLPSRTAPDGDREGVPVSLMEAMGSGLAVLSTNHSGIPELVTHESSGLLVPEGDEAALAAALDRLLSDPALRSRLGNRARAEVADRCDVRHTAAALCRLWTTIAAGGRPEGG